MAVKKVSGRASSMAVGVVTGAVVSVTILLILTATMAWLVMDGKMREDIRGFWLMITHVIATIPGAIVATSMVKRRRFLVCIAVGGTFFAFLVALTASFFGGQYQGVFVSCILIMFSSAAVGIVASRRQETKVKYHRKYRTG